MPLTAAQKTALKNDIIAASDQACVDLESSPTNSDLASAVAALYNLPAATDFWGNFNSVPLAEIKANITFKNYTAVDAVPSSGGTTQITNDLLVYLSRLVFTQNLQLNINNLLLVGTSFDATKANLVAGLKDATNTDMPTGTAGATRKGGWSDVQKIICRKGTRAEKLFADTSAANGSSNTLAATFTFEGSLNFQQVLEAMAQG